MTPASLDDLRKAFDRFDARPTEPPRAVDAANSRLRQALWNARNDIRAVVRAMEPALADDRLLTEAEKIAQGKACGCRGADDMCPCQNVRRK